MLRISICDDDKEQQKKIYDMVSREVFGYDDAEFIYYSSGEQLIESIKKDGFFCDLLFLDINMQEKNGLEVAEFIRQYNVDVDIIFVTVSTEHVFDGYTYNAFSYLVKPVVRERLEKELKRYMEGKFSQANCLHVTINNRREKILLDQVYYFEGEARKIHAHQKQEEQSFYAKIGDLEETLRGQNFIRCHQSYLVNRRYITGHTRNAILLGDRKIPISRKYIEKVKECLKGVE